MKRYYFRANNKIDAGYTAIVLAEDEDDAKRLMSEYASDAGLADLWRFKPIDVNEISAIKVSCDYLIQDTVYDDALGEVIPLYILGMPLPFGEFLANTDVAAFAQENNELEGPESTGVLYTVVASPYTHVSGTVRVPEGEDVKEYINEHFNEIVFGEPDMDFAGTDIDIFDEDGEAIDNED